MQKERILYPCYFKKSLTRREGRRVPKGLASDHPSVKDLDKACQKLRLECRVEEANHPAYWGIHEGRAVVLWDGKKEELIRQVAKTMRGGK
jgi:signal recognition particle subunit SRP19